MPVGGLAERSLQQSEVADRRSPAADCGPLDCLNRPLRSPSPCSGARVRLRSLGKHPTVAQSPAKITFQNTSAVPVR